MAEMQKETVAVTVDGHFEGFVEVVEEAGCDWAVEGDVIVLIGWPEDLARFKNEMRRVPRQFSVTVA